MRLRVDRRWRPSRSSRLVKSVQTEKMQAAALRIPKGKGDGEVEPPLGSTGAAAEDGGDAGDAGARDNDAVASLAVMPSCDMPASTQVGELWRAARRRSARACRERWPERPLHRVDEVGAAGSRPGERSCMR